MRTLLTVIIGLLCATFLDAQVVSNGGFESWVDGEPVDWITSNSTYGTAISRSEDSHSGAYAAFGQAYETIDITWAPDLVSGEPGAGTPITKNYNLLSFYLKFDDGGTDKLRVGIDIIDENFALLGRGILEHRGSLEEYTLIEVPIDYYSAATAAYARIDISTQEGTGSGTPSFRSWFLIDDVELSIPESDENDILTFTFWEQSDYAHINAVEHRVDIEVHNGTDLTSLTPTFSLSPGATADPVSETTSDYSSPFTITVTSSSGITQDWTINVTEEDDNEANDNDILSFIITRQTGPPVIDDFAHTIEAEVANGMDLTNLAAQWHLSEGATSDPVSGVTGDYSSIYTITVTAQDGSTQDWAVDVTEAGVEQSSRNDILSFIIENATGEADIDNLVHEIDIEVKNGTDLTSLTAQWTLSEGATSDPVSGSTSDYSSIFTITVTAEDGSTQDWEVEVTEAEADLSEEKDILTFFIENGAGEADIDNLVHEIDIEVINGTDLTSLTAQWTLSEGATSDPVSGSTSDYSSIFTITVTAEDGSTQEWEVEVTEAEAGGSNEKDILSFFIESATGPADIDNIAHNVEIEVANGTDLTNLTAQWTLSEGATSDPVSGSTSDYSSIFTITVTAEDASTQDWEVDVTVAEVEESNEKDILSFIILNGTGPADIDNIAHNVEIEVEYGTDLTSLPAQWTLSDGATSDPVSGTTGDYSSIYTITVTAEDGSTQDWEVVVTEATDLSDEKDILAFIIENGTGPAEIDNLAQNIEIKVASGTDLTSLTAMWLVSEGATSDPVSGTTSDYSNTFTITVTAEDGSAQDWQVNVSEAVDLSDDNDILTFTFPEETGSAVIDAVEHTVDIEVANGTDLTILTPTFTLSAGATADPVSGTTSNYSNTIAIRVTAENGSGQYWRVYVTEAGATGIDDPKSANLNIEIYPNPVKDILSIKSEERISGIVITSLNGKVIKKLNQPELSTINVSDLKPGTYIISFFDKDVRIMSEIIVKE